jgi:hypothetical protein
MEPNKLDRPLGMMRSELVVLRDLVASSGAKRVLEVGMAFGSSTEAILTALRGAGGGHLTSIDPFQLVPPPQGFGGEGLAKVRALGAEDMHTFLSDPDYLAMPDLVRAGSRFDFVFVDGYHSLDYALVDVFFADLLLVPGGMLLLHDSSSVAVYKVCKFIEHNKAYRRVGPPPGLIYKSLARRGIRRAYQLATGNSSAVRERRERWKSLAAFVKESDGMAAEFEVQGL